MAVISPVEVFRTPQKHEGRLAVGSADPSYRAFEALYLTFIVMPIIAGLGMTTGTLVNWRSYLAPALGLGAGTGGLALIRAFGALEIVTGAP